MLCRRVTLDRPFDNFGGFQGLRLSQNAILRFAHWQFIEPFCFAFS